MTNLQRKSTRLPNYNYSTTAYYFITICTVKHKCMFSIIVGEGSSLPNVYDKVDLKLTENGNIVDKAIKELPLKYSNINISNYIIMPNHLHMIIELQNGRENPSTTSISQVIGYFKHFTTKQINKGKKTILKIWQRSFYDHIIRDEKDYQRIVKYMQLNPLKWQLDKYYKS